MHPDIYQIFSEIGEHEFRIGLYTNGVLMDNDLRNMILCAANETDSEDLSYVSFNVSSSLVKGSFDDILLPRIKALCRGRDLLERRVLEINAPILTVPGIDPKVLDGAVQKLQDIGIDNIRISPPWEQHNRDENGIRQKREQEKQEIEVIRRLQEKYPRIKTRDLDRVKDYDKCYIMAMGLTIDSYGDVYPCPEVASPYFRYLSYGNIIEKNISDIWHSTRHQKLFERFDPRECSCECCPVDEDVNTLCHKLKNGNKRS
jgi:radical SAM protein with 4Fe4S-binding SPASM domain